MRSLRFILPFAFLMLIGFVIISAASCPGDSDSSASKTDQNQQRSPSDGGGNTDVDSDKEPVVTPSYLVEYNSGTDRDNVITIGDLDNTYNLFVIDKGSLKAEDEYSIVISDGADNYCFKSQLSDENIESDKVRIGLSGSVDSLDGVATCSKWDDASKKELIDANKALSINVKISDLAEKSFTGITPEDRSKIYTWRDLQAIRYDLARAYTIEKDILFPEPGKNGFPATGFVPIGIYSNRFTGSLDGKTHKIQNFYINRSGEDYVGLFGSVDSLGGRTIVVRDLSIELREGNADNPSISGKKGVGALVGFVSSRIVEGVSVKGGYIKGSEYVGGIVGDSIGFDIISSSVSDTSIVGVKIVGGFVGQINQREITQSRATRLKVTGTTSVGWIAGSFLLNGNFDDAVVGTSADNATVNGNPADSNNRFGFAGGT